MIGSVEISDQEKEIIIPLLKEYIESNKDLKIEVPVNLVFTLAMFLQASEWYSDMNGSQLPYPSFENLSHLFKEELMKMMKDNNVKKHPKFGGEAYTVYKMLSDTQWSRESFKKFVRGEIK